MTDKDTRIGFIGLGIMGKPMAMITVYEKLAGRPVRSGES